MPYLLRSAIASTAASGAATTATPPPAASASLTVTPLTARASTHGDGNTVGAVVIHLGAFLFGFIEVVASLDGDGAGVRQRLAIDGLLPRLAA